jgi:hypothetical protein
MTIYRSMAYTLYAKCMKRITFIECIERYAVHKLIVSRRRKEGAANGTRTFSKLRRYSMSWRVNDLSISISSISA